ncbi:aminotransferase class V-fold PLP-dependent enzyme [Clostridiaceae bacterium HSG29]|nr:aminotransferase class V-fold PLP-dependent enzyme [Clostridiaceae bacterium HSG29]
MISFKNDYSEGAHENIINLLVKSNLKQENGYGEDNYSTIAREKIKKTINNDNIDIHFISGGTQANLTVISSILKPYESVIAAKTGHICVHETGAIEATGHKINEIETKNGKLYPELILPILNEHTDEHMVKPKLVFISNSTEIGTVYTKDELVNLSEFCKSNDLLLYLDGARLGSALTSEGNDLTLEDLSKLLDVFYIGGTKNGALIGEAIIIINDELKDNFRFNLKQKGALLAKGRLIAIQFVELFTDNLFFKLATHANLMAKIISDEIKKLGFEFLTDSKSNQIFPILPNKLINKLEKNYDFYIWQKIDNDTSAIRIVTSWATKEILFF